MIGDPPNYFTELIILIRPMRSLSLSKALFQDKWSADMFIEYQNCHIRIAP